MDECLEKLQKLGVQKIYEDTHIPRQYVESILESDFQNFSKIQFLGFLSILQREYKCDLSELREKAISFFGESVEEESVFIEPKKNHKKKIVYLSTIMFLFVMAFILKVSNSNAELVNEEHTLENNIIESVVKEIKNNKEVNRSDGNNSVVTQEVNEPQEAVKPIEKKIEQKSFVIVPKSKVWFGYIDVATHKKYQKTFSEETSLDPKKEWLLMFGHGYIDMFINGKVQKFSNRSKVRFFYSDGEVRAISLEEFKQLNRGRKW